MVLFLYGVCFFSGNNQASKIYCNTCLGCILNCFHGRCIFWLSPPFCRQSPKDVLQDFISYLPTKKKLSKQKSCIAILGSTVVFAYAQHAQHQELFAAWLDGQQIHLLADACAGGPCPQASTPNRKYVISSWEITGGTSIFGHSHKYTYIYI